MKLDRLMAAARAVWSRMPDYRDVHIYGGLALVAVGGNAILAGLGFALAGVALCFLGVTRLG